jgi:NADP-dependent 3-hydroxy acid dehydrogenase YdfG
MKNNTYRRRKSTVSTWKRSDTARRKERTMQISGSSAVVVGGTGGLGEATVRRLHAAGAKVVVADVADEKGKALEQ